MAVEDLSHGNLQIAGDGYTPDINGEDIVTITDRSGNPVQYHLFEGVLYYPFYKMDLIKGIRSFKMRSDDIYLPGYPRTGTHWAFEMASMLLKGRAETIQRSKEHLEIVYPDKFEQLPTPRIINAHMKLSVSPDDVKLKKVKIIYTLRDPKDVVVSMYNVFYGRPLPGGTYIGTFEDYLHLFLSGKVDHNGLMEHWRDANKFFNDNPDIPVHFQRYEETLQDPLLAVQNLSDFLGRPRNDDLCHAIAVKCEFARMKTDKDKYAMKLDGENFLFRQGTVGDWSNYFTEKMLEEYYRVYEEMLGGTRFYSLYNTDTVL